MPILKRKLREVSGIEGTTSYYNTYKILCLDCDIVCRKYYSDFFGFCTAIDFDGRFNDCYQILRSMLNTTLGKRASVKYRQIIYFY